MDKHSGLLAKIAVLLIILIVVDGEDHERYMRPCIVSINASENYGRSKFSSEKYIDGLCTHIIFAELSITRDHKIGNTDELRMLEKTLENMKNIIVPKIVAIGGNEIGSSRVACERLNSHSHLEKIIADIEKLVEKNNLAGLLIDWIPKNVNEYTDCFLRYYRFVKGIRNKLKHTRSFILFASVYRSDSPEIDVKKLSLMVDFVILAANPEYTDSVKEVKQYNQRLTKDYNTDDDEFNLGRSIIHSVEALIGAGMPAKKILITITLFGKGTNLVSNPTDSQFGIFLDKSLATSFSPPGRMTYFELCDLNKYGGIVERTTEEDKLPSVKFENQWYGYEDSISIEIKLDFIINNKLGGAVINKLEDDDMDALCEDKQSFPLTSLVARKLEMIDVGKVTNFCIWREDGLYSIGDRCWRYAYCLKNQYWPQNCPSSDLYFNDKTKSCSVIKHTEKPECNPRRPDPPANKGFIRPCFVSEQAQYRFNRGNFTPGAYVKGLCTHIVYNSIAIEENGKIRVPSYDPAHNRRYMINGLKELKKIDSNLQFMFSYGAHYPSRDILMKKIANSTERNILTWNMIGFANDYNYNGINIDFSFMDKSTSSYANVFVKELLIHSEKYAKSGTRLIISVLLPSLRFLKENSHLIPDINRYADFVMLGTYDEYQNIKSDSIQHISPLRRKEPLNKRSQIDLTKDMVFSVDSIVKPWFDYGLDKRKMVIGVPTYARGYKTTLHLESQRIDISSIPTPPQSITKRPGFAAYYEICDYLVAREASWDEDHGAAYLMRENEFFTFESTKSLKLKMEFVKEERLGGAYVDLDLDDIHGTCSRDNKFIFPLTRVIAQILDNITIPKIYQKNIKVHTVIGHEKAENQTIGLAN